MSERARDFVFISFSCFCSVIHVLLFSLSFPSPVSKLIFQLTKTALFASDVSVCARFIFSPRSGSYLRRRTTIAQPGVAALIYRKKTSWKSKLIQNSCLFCDFPISVVFFYQRGFGRQDFQFMNECKIIQLVPCVRGFDLHLCKHTPIRTHTHTHCVSHWTEPQIQST